MNITRFGLSATAIAVSGALVLTGCTSSGNTTGASSGDSAVITANGSEPQNPLIPTNTNEVGGGRIIDSLFSRLVYYDANGKPHNDIAESIETEDAQNYTIKIRDNAVFTNEEKVTASSFVEAWNYGAKLSNKQLSSYFFENIEGFSYDEDTELTGLKVVSDTEFTVALTSKVSDFPLRLGYAAFAPLPKVAFEDMEAFGKNPIGNGPYKLASANAWKHNEQIELVKNETYNGIRKAKNEGIRFIFYASLEAAYADLRGGNLDILDAIPDNALATYEDDFAGRSVNQAAAIIQSITIPERLAHFAGEEGKFRRKAISMAINREEITKIIFEGTRTPASDFTSPVIDGWSDSIPGSEVLKYDPVQAKDLWAQADAIAPWTGSFQVGYNADGGHQTWADAVANNIKNALDIDASGAPSPTFSEFRTNITNRSIQTSFRSGWQGDYPGLFNFLGPLYGTNAGSNDGQYSNPEVDRLLTEGLAQTTAESANKFFLQAQEVLFQDLPAIPLWYSNVNGAFSEKAHNVAFGWDGVPLYYQVEKTQ